MLGSVRFALFLIRGQFLLFSMLTASAFGNSDVFEMSENIVGKGENAGHQHFLLSPQCYKKACSLESLNHRIVFQKFYNCKS